MVDSQQLGTLLGQSQMSEEERNAWLVIIPHMDETTLRKLFDILLAEQIKIKAIREEFAGKIHAATNDG
ncbi:MAG: hypothetical protein Q8P30_04990 [Candidatus Uhrbacteria bacterium]|nr:hypothetical protein [Candidatus Uhrbacteria bacterium]